MRSLSASTRSTTAARSACHCTVMVLTGAPGHRGDGRDAVGAEFVADGAHGFRSSFDDGGDAHAAADAQRAEPRFEPAPLQLVEQRAEQHRAGGAERVAERDRAAVDVDLLVRHAHLAHEAHRHGGEGLVDLEQVDVVHRQPGLGERLARGRHRAGEHDGRVGPDSAVATMRPRGVSPSSRPWLAADQHRRRAVDDARGRCRRGARARCAPPADNAPAPPHRSPSRPSRRRPASAAPGLPAWCAA